MKKFAIIGSSCAGKTSLTHTLVGRLKSYGVLADGVYSQDRKFSFPISQIESEAAQNWMVANMIAKEADLQLHTDVQVLISDRSPLDLFAYYAHQYSTTLSQAAKAYVMEWCKGYEALYYMEPLPYQDDTKRPPDDFRLAVDAELGFLMDEARDIHGVNVQKLPRNVVLQDIMQRCSIRKPGVKSQLGPDDIQRLSNYLKFDVFAKFPREDCDSLSDTDMWIIVPDLRTVSWVVSSLTGRANEYLRNHAGPWPLFDIMVTDTPSGLPQNLFHATPE